MRTDGEDREANGVTYDRLGPFQGEHSVIFHRGMPSI
jgi:hypothetical protein